MATVSISSVGISASLPPSADDSLRLKNIHKLHKFEPCPKDLGSIIRSASSAFETVSLELSLGALKCLLMQFNDIV